MMKWTHAFFAVAVLLLATVRLEPGVASAAGQPMLVVVAASFPVTNITLADLRRAFQGQAAEAAGKRLIPINHPTGSPLRASFDRAVLGLEPAEVGRFWVDKRIRDEGAPPKTAPSAELALRIVASLPGAITYVGQEGLNPTVKALTVDGKSGGQAGYPLAQ